MQHVKIIISKSEREFEEECNKYTNIGYKVSSSSCSVLGKDDIEGVKRFYQCILVNPNDEDPFFETGENKEKKRMMNLEDTAKELQVSKHFLYTKAVANEIPHVRCGVKRLFDITLVKKWLDEQQYAIKNNKQKNENTVKKL